MNTLADGSPHSSPGGGLYVQYGCGLCAPEGWLNFDSSLRLRLERLVGLRGLLRQTAGLVFPANVRFGDIVKGLPVAPGSARGIYCSHVLEHLARDDLPVALRNTLNLLVPGGLFRLVVPDLHWRAAQYLKASDRGVPAAADILLDGCKLGIRARERGVMSLMKHRLSKNAHLWMYDFAALKGLLEQAGFVGVRRCELGDANDPMFGLVEDQGRYFESGERELALEATKSSDGRGRLSAATRYRPS